MAATSTSSLPSHRSQGKRCRIHRPSPEDLSQSTFSDYIRQVVFPPVTVDVNHTTGKLLLDEGIAKITFPKHFFRCVYGNDTTGRGDSWDTINIRLETPIQQNLRGLAGVYEYTHSGIAAMDLSEFRIKADEYAIDQLGETLFQTTQHMQNTTESNENDLMKIERRFWKRLTPTMPPPIYGADQEATLFDPNSTNDFCLSNLDSCLNLLADSIPGVTTPYLYAGMFATVFCAHTEDMDLLSINYLHAGAPKLWYSVPEIHAKRFESLCEHYYAQESNHCKEFLRHKRNLLSPAILKKAGIPYVTAVQYPGDAIVTFPGSYHFGFNIGYNIAEATNFAVPEWIPFGDAAKICLCRPDSVRIHMGRLKELLQIYQYDTMTQKLSYSEWRRKFQEETTKLLMAQETSAGTTGAILPEGVASIEPTGIVAPVVLSAAPVVEPTLSSQPTLSPATGVALSAIGGASIPAATSSAITSTSPAKTKAATSPKKKKAKKVKLSDQQRKKEFWVELTGRPEDWRLAVPIQKTNKAKSLSVDRRILLFVSPNDELGIAVAAVRNHQQQQQPQEEEACFAGIVVEVADGHVRLHLDGQPRSNDVWIPIEKTKHKVFVDGGKYQSDQEMPALHYCVEQDSRAQRWGQRVVKPSGSQRLLIIKSK